jgi:lipoate-protein ligase B
MGNRCRIQWLGQVEFKAALRLQRELVVKRAANEIPNTMLLLEYPHTYSVGFEGHRQYLLTNGEELKRQNIAYYEVDRGGAVSYHGPGQLVGSVILDLKEYGYNYHTYISKLESVIIRALHHFKIHAFRQPGQRGIWVLPSNPQRNIPQWVETHDYVAKIGCVEVKVNDTQITGYGFALNVSPDLNYFDSIVPPGVTGCKFTSLQQVLNKPLKIGAAIEPVIQSFCEVFELEPLYINLPALPGEAIITSAGDLASTQH